jgi:hypothetical protein
VTHFVLKTRGRHNTLKLEARVTIVTLPSFHPDDARPHARSHSSTESDGKENYLVLQIENPTRCHRVSKLYFIFIWSSTCFGRHTAHHQQPKTVIVASDFAYEEGCRTCSCWTLSGSVRTRGCLCSFRLLMMGGVSPETYWASFKYEINFWYTAASCWIFFL